MKNRDNWLIYSAELRKRAEETSRIKTAWSLEDVKALAPEEVQRKLHDLCVHQIELEMQNDDLRRAQEKLAGAQARYFDLYDLAPVGYCTVSERGLILEANLTAATLLGVARDALAKQPFSLFVIKEYQDIYYLYRKQLFKTGKPQACELKLVKKDRTAFWARLETTVAQDADGAPVCRVTLSDITESKRAEKALKEAAEIKSKFASMVSHELRSPLTAIALGVSLVLEEAGYLSAAHKNLLNLVHDNTDRLGRLINNVLDFQKMASGKTTFNILENDINDLVRTTAWSMGLLAKKKGLDLIVAMSNGIPRARFDKDKIIQVLTNLLVNAIAHTEKGNITVHAGYENDMLRVAVRDTGRGIKAVDLPKLFQPFEQLDSGPDRKIGGTGLGLAIAKEIILAHNGKIWAESEPGKGSVFHFALPVTQGRG